MEKTNEHPPLLKPDRQILYPKATNHFEWPAADSLHDRDTITVDRISANIDGPGHRFVIKRHDTVEVFFRKDQLDIGEVVGISHRNGEVKVRFANSSGGIWFNKGCVYPTLEPEPPRPVDPVTLTEACKAASSEPEGGFTEADRVTENEHSASRQTTNLEDQVLNFLSERNGTPTKLDELRRELGASEVDREAPEENPVHQALKTLRDSGRVHVTEPRWGEPTAQVITWPTTGDEWRHFSPPEKLSGAEVTYLMQKHHISISDLAERMQITQKRIREVRERGLDGKGAIRDWVEAIGKPKAEKVFTLDDHKAFRKRANVADLSATEWREEFERMLDSRTEFIAGLKKQYNATQLKNLAGNLGNFGARQNTKHDNARAVFRSLLQMFLIENSFGYDPMRETQEEAVARNVRAIDQSKLDDYYKEKGLRKGAQTKALENPETLEEFRTFLRHRDESGLTEKKLSLYDSLQAELSRERRAKEKPTTVTQFQSEELDDGFEFTLTDGYHSKKECPLYIAKLHTRVERPTFNELNRKAKMLGGWYSSFVKSQAGFQFLDVETRTRFVSLLNGDEDRTDVLERRKERKEQTAAERLHELAEDMLTRADETIEQSKESLQNTARRADIQAGIRGRAYADQALARSLHSIAESLSTGGATFLDGIRHKVQIEALDSVLYQAKWKRLREMKANQGTYQDEDEKPIGSEVIRFAEYPFPHVYKRHLEVAIEKCRSAKGAKMATRRMEKQIKGEDEYITFKHESEIEELSDFLIRAKGARFDTAHIDASLDRFKRLRRANIYDIHELRAALREYLPHRAEARGDDPVAVAERELIGKKLPGFFPTPRVIIEEILEYADIQPGEWVLEPSCGKGDIVQAIQETYPDNPVHAIEFNRTLEDVLGAKGLDVQFQNFLEHGGSYDKIVMNPPFENGADIEHVRHAYSLLRPGGRVVAVMSESPFFRSDRKATEFREWLDELGGESHKLPEDAFSGADAFRQTGVRTRIVVLGK